MDGLLIRVLSQDWEAKFTHARIDKIHQPSDRELILTIRTRKETSRVLLSAHRMFARAHELLHHKPTNPSVPPMFCMLLRKYIEGGKIIGVRQQGWDRVLQFSIESYDEIGDLKQYALILEMMGKHSNLMLCTADHQFNPVKIIDSVVHVTPEISRFRLVLPGQPYKPAPPQDKVAPTEVTGVNLSDLAQSEQTEKSLVRALTSRVAGIGPWTAKEAIHRAGALDLTDAHAYDKIAQSLVQLAVSCLTASTPNVGLDELGRPVAVAPFALTVCHKTVPTPSLSDGIERVQYEAMSKSQVTALTSDMERALLDRIDKLRGKLSKLQEEWKESQLHEAFRIKGELLTAYAYMVHKGDNQATLPNFYDDEKPLVIELDPALTAIENAQKYFKQSSKRKRALSILTQELEATEADLEYLENALIHLHEASPENLAAIRQELVEQGFFRANAKQKKLPTKTTRAPLQPDSYLSSDGFTIRVGRNNLQNDRLTLKSSQGDDIWLHVKGLPGSHVVIQTSRQNVPESTLHEAALLAAYFSKGKDSVNVPVDYCEIKHVWKPNGARPGHVLYENQRTLSVTPDRNFIEPILRSRA